MASLAEALYELPTERLRLLIQNRKMDLKKLALIPGKRQLTQALATELSKPASIAQAIMQCNARHLRLLQLLLTGEGDKPVAWSDLLEVAGGPSLSDALQVVVKELEDMGLAFRTGRGVYLPPAIQTYVPASLPDRYTLTRCLNNYDAAGIKRICENLGIPPDTKAANIEAIRAQMLDQGPGVTLSRPLDEEEREVLEYLLQVGGSATPIEVASEALEGHSDDFFRYDWQSRWKQGRERNAIDRLLGRGILHVVAYGYGFNLVLVIPGDLLRALTGDADNTFWTEPTPSPQPISVPPPVVTRHTTLIRDVVVLQGFLATQDAARTSTGHIHKTSLKNLARQLSLPNERYASFLYAVCREADLISIVGEKQIYAITTRGLSWLQWDSLVQIRTLFEAWRKGALWAEMCSDPLFKAGEYRQEESVVDMREAALKILTEVDADKAYELDSVTDTLAYCYPMMLSRGVRMTGDLVPSPSAFIRLLTAECLYWLGLVELGWADPQTAGRATGKESDREESAASPLSYQLTAIGTHLLARADAAPVESDPREEQFVLQANAEIFVPPYLEPATFYHLLALTETPKNGTGNVVTLTRESIRRCLDRGDTTRDILAFLQTHSRTGIPQNVEYLINEVGGKHGHIHIGRAQMYLQVDSALLMKELQARREIKPYFVRTLGDTVALLKADDPEKLLRELRKAGYLPVSDDAPQKRMLGVKVRPAPAAAAPPATTLQKQARRAEKAEATIDWDRIAREDGKPWREERQEEPVVSVLRNPALIKILLNQASKSHKRVVVEMNNANGIGTRQLTLSLLSVSGDSVFARDESGVAMNLKLSQIIWARLAQ